MKTCERRKRKLKKSERIERENEKENLKVEKMIARKKEI